MSQLTNYQSVEEIISQLEVKVEDSNSLQNSAKDGSTAVRKGSDGLDKTYKSLQNSNQKFAEESVSELKTTFNEAADNFEKAEANIGNHNTNLKNTLESTKESVSEHDSNNKEFTDDETAELVSGAKSDIEKYKKAESDYHSLVQGTKSDIDTKYSQFTQDTSDTQSSLEKYQTLNNIVDNAGGAEELQQQLDGITTKTGLINKLRQLNDGEDVDDIINDSTDLSNIETLKSSIVDQAFNDIDSMENLLGGSIEDGDSIIANVTGSVNSSISSAVDFMDTFLSGSTTDVLTGAGVLGALAVTGELDELSEFGGIGVNGDTSDVVSLSDDDIEDLRLTFEEDARTYEVDELSEDLETNFGMSEDYGLSVINEDTSVTPTIISNAGTVTSGSEDTPTEETTTPTEEYIEKTTDDGEKLFNGIAVQNAGTTDVLAALRKKYYESQDMTEGFVAPWDGRLGAAYSNSQSIGNHMPYGIEWVGSPTIMNPYALIRFDHIAGKEHHHKLIDQRSNYQFRSSRVQPVVTLKTLDEQGISYSSAGTAIDSSGDQRSVVTLNGDTAKQLGVESTDAVFQDETGALYVDEIDKGVLTWKPQLDTSADPTEVTVIDTQAGNEATAVKISQLNKLKNGESTETAKTEALTGSVSEGVYTPNQEEYWYQLRGWVKCQGIYVPRANCVKGKVSEETVSSKDYEEQKETVTEQLQRVKEYVDYQVSRKWQHTGYGTNKRYLRTANTSPVSMKIVEPTTANLVDTGNWKGREQFFYKWADFLYCKYYNLIPNNYLVTLRRFPVPISDAATVPKQESNHQHVIPSSMAITWLGEETGNKLSDILSMNMKIKWRELTADVHSVDGVEQGADSSPFGQGIAKWLGRIDAVSGGGKFGQVSGWDEQRAKFDPYKDGEYSNRIYGPVNVIDKTLTRDRGLDFNQDITLNFHYSLKSIGGVNPKAAMLDILANILALTYNNANFWGGAVRYFPNKPQYPFLGAERGFKAWYKGDVTGFIDGVADQLTSALGNLSSMIMGLFTNPQQALKQLASGVGKVFMAEKQREKRPGILAFKSLLTGEPVGEWHLMIGNPFNPVAMIGNLICDETTISFSDERFGPDDFPQDMIVTIKLKHGKPRDKGDIESMFNRGAGRLHYSYFGKKEPWNSAFSTRNVNPGKKVTSVDNNFTGSKTSVSSVTFSPTGETGGNPRLATARVVGGATDNALKLAEKVGFKSGS